MHRHYRGDFWMRHMLRFGQPEKQRETQIGIRPKDRIVGSAIETNRTETMSYFAWDSIEERLRLDLDASELTLRQKFQAVARLLEYLANRISEEDDK